ncbi:unnamed protein product [Cylicocyclus nassatus]|uniref:Uncharacterized protein n=1 Tax=Cylicocyclus nassatus TaxID=53992 RepID=A0AA36MGQ5_CYLNA|nr:unnamed protein product [Cylicocyclus nassatus]
MFSNILDKLSRQLHDFSLKPWKGSSSVPPTPQNSRTNLVELTRVETNPSKSYDYQVKTEKRIYKRSDPIDIVYPKKTL